MAKVPPLSHTQVRLLHEILLCLNLSLVLCYSTTMYNFRSASLSMGTGDAYAFLYCFIRSAVRINRFLPAVPRKQGFESWPYAGGKLGVELAFGISVVCIGIALLSLLKLVRGSRLLKAILKPFAGFVVLLALPAAYIMIFDRGWTVSELNMISPVMIPELICFCILFLVYLRHPFSIWAMGILMLVHYCIWCLAIAGNVFFHTIYGNLPPPVLLLLIPVGGAAWLLYLKTSVQDSPVTPQRGYGNKWVLVGLAVSAVGLGGLWLPGRGYSLVHAQNPDSLSIEMRRSNCQTSCPVYTVTIHGSGMVDYMGEQHVRVRGSQQSFLSQDQVHTLLEAFDRAGFFSLEDQAFAWSYHASRVAVKITVDGRTKEVSSDTVYIGAKSGSQAKFVEAASTIDKVVGTDRWVKCGDSRCQP